MSLYESVHTGVALVRLRFPLQFSFLLLFLMAAALAQSPNGTISGLVLDPSGRAIAGADVQIVNDATDVRYPGATNGEGIYAISNLPPGSYRIQVSRTGFKTLIKPDVLLSVQDALAINFTLPVGAVAETVTIEGGAPLVNTESATVSTVVDQNFVENMPLNGRSFNTLVLLVPGAVGTPSTASQPGQFSFNGQRTDANDFQVDGASVNLGVSLPGGYQAGAGGTPAFNVIGGTSGLVSVDAMQEFRVQTSSFAPEFGRTPGGQVSIVTRSGTNNFHGTAFDYFRNTVLDANDWFANAAGVQRAPEHQNDFGGVFGGPILRDKTFFFFSYEGLRVDQPETLTSTVPSLSFRSSATSPAAAALLAAYAIPNGPILASCDDDLCAQLTSTVPAVTSLNSTSIRIDHHLSSRLNLFARYSYALSSIVAPYQVPNVLQSTNEKMTSLTLGLSATLTNQATNTVRFNYSRQNIGGDYQLVSSQGAVAPESSLLFPASLSPSSTEIYFDPGPFSPLYVGSQSAKNGETQLEFLDDLAVTRGTHSLKFGVDLKNLYLDTKLVPTSLSYFSSTSSPEEFAQNGTIDVFGVSDQPSKILVRFVSLYAQDQWKIGQRLSLTYGLRWEINPSPAGRGGTSLVAWENTDDPAITRIAPAGTRLWKTKLDHFAPRVGAAYHLTSKGDLVLRAGAGIFYDLGTGTVPQLAYSFPNTSTLYSPGATLPLASSSGLLPPPLSLNPPYNSSIVNGFADDLTLPRSYQWNVALEKAIADTQALSVTYVGQGGRQLLRPEYISQPNSNFGDGSYFFYTYNGDSSSYNALQMQYRVRTSRAIQVLANYTFSHSIDTGSNDQNPNTSSQIINPSSGRGSSAFDVRHNVSGALHYEPGPFAIQSFVGKVINHWAWDAIAVARTGFPVTVRTYDVAIPGNILAVRPDVVPGQPFYVSDSTAPEGRVLNSAAFVVQTEAREGTLPRDAIRGFGMWQTNFSLARTFPLTERANLQLRVDAFNAINHPNFSDPSSLLGFGGFGRANSMLNSYLGGLSSLYQVGGPRSLQIMLRLSF
jgi:carboxypeptidase family protein/TonB-dependent receptor-like protein